jgi:hypothetical protein
MASIKIGLTTETESTKKNHYLVTVITNKLLPKVKKFFFFDQINNGFPTEPLANGPHQ